MIKLLKLLELPHITAFKSRGVRRLMILITIPQELLRANVNVFRLAAYWWRWENPKPTEG